MPAHKLCSELKGDRGKNADDVCPECGRCKATLESIEASDELRDLHVSANVMFFPERYALLLKIGIRSLVIVIH